MEVDESRPSKEEVKRAIRHLKNGKAAGPDGIPLEAIKADLETSAEMLYNLFGKIWETNEIPDGLERRLCDQAPEEGSSEGVQELERHTGEASCCYQLLEKC